ncbi:AFG1-like ATPase [Paraphaeosphaeria sporulosa]
MASQTALEAAYRTLISRGRLSHDNGQAALVSRLAQLQTSLSQPRSKLNAPAPRGVYIYGSVGTGKSRIADLFAATLPAQISRRRIHFHEFMLDVHARLHTARSQSSFRGDPLIQIGMDVRKESQVLCFDEFQVTDIADAMILKRLFSVIWGTGGVLVGTSNRPPEKLYENGLNRDLFVPFIHQIKDRCEVWKMEGQDDYRTKDIDDPADRIEVLFLDHSRFEESLHSQLSGQALQHFEIAVHGNRGFSVSAARPNDKTGLVVSSTFIEMCHSYRGSADYVALCRQSKAIYISKLRRFAKDDLDVVRRFITLVDLAYEAKVRIFCLSDVPLVEVFANIVRPVDVPLQGQMQRQMTVRGEGGSSSSMMTTFVGETEWSATGLAGASLATGGAGETDVRFAIGRAISRLYEMGSKRYGIGD